MTAHVEVSARIGLINVARWAGKPSRDDSPRPST